MTEDQVALGGAMMMLRRHGEHAPLRVAERIGKLAAAGDWDGVCCWKAIGAHMDQILRPGHIQ